MKCIFEGTMQFHTRVYENGITITVRKFKDTWEVFYMTDGFPMTFGFGIPYNKHTLSQVWGYAEANAHQICMTIFLS